MDAARKPDGEPEIASAKNELLAVESPPLSPASEAVAPAAAEPPEPVPVASVAEHSGTPASPKSAGLLPKIWPRFTVRPRHRRYVPLVASVAISAALGAGIGALASGALLPPSAKRDMVSAEQNKAMQQSIAKLNKEIATLTTNFDHATRAARTQAAKISDRLEHQATEITGSVSTPQTVPVAPPITEPVPLPRPAQRMAGIESPPGRIPVVLDWTIHDFRNGYVFVEGHGEVYQVQIGAPLPGLGPVQAVRRRDGHWMVLTPRGMIVSMRDRRYFADY